MALRGAFDAAAFSVQISEQRLTDISSLWKSDSISAIDHIIVDRLKRPLPPHHPAVLLAPHKTEKYIQELAALWAQL